MVNSNRDIMAQGVFLAQLYAAKGACKCQACHILRKATQQMSAAFLSESTKPAGAETLEPAEALVPGDESGGE